MTGTRKERSPARGKATTAIWGGRNKTHEPYEARHAGSRRSQRVFRAMPTSTTWACRCGWASSKAISTRANTNPTRGAPSRRRFAISRAPEAATSFSSGNGRNQCDVLHAV